MQETVQASDTLVQLPNGIRELALLDDLNALTPARISAVKEIAAYEKEYECDSKIPKIDRSDWPTSFDKLQSHLGNERGSRSKLPLSYVIRTTVEVPDEGEDPRTNYASLEDEMVARAPHTSRMCMGTT